MKKFKHSGTLGDLVYALPIVKAFGGGEFYLHLDQINWIGKHFYGSTPDPFHQGRMTQQDFAFMHAFMESQSYITKFNVLDTKTTEITHNLDRFRSLFVGHPGNYVDIYAKTFSLNENSYVSLRNTPWLSVPEPKTIPGKSYVINRTARWAPQELNPAWADLQEQGAESQGVFVGLPEEHRAFQQFTGWKIDHYPTADMLELAEVIAGCEQFIGNQSVALSLAIGLGVPYACEARRDLPLERNECYFPDHPNGDYF